MPRSIDSKSIPLVGGIQGGSPVALGDLPKKHRRWYPSGHKSVREVLLHVGSGPEPMRAILPSRRRSAVLAPSPSVERVRLTLDDGALTTLWVARFDRSRFGVRVVALDPPSTLLRWCTESGAENAMIGGFYMRPGGPPLGDLRIGGRALPSVPFDSPWGALRGCVHAGDGEVSLAPRGELPGEPAGDLLQAGPMLVASGRIADPPGSGPRGLLRRLAPVRFRHHRRPLSPRRPRPRRRRADRRRLRRTRQRRGGPDDGRAGRRRWSASAPSGRSTSTAAARPRS